MALKKTEKGWIADIQPGGRGCRRFQKTFNHKADALAWIAQSTANANQSPDWQPLARDARTLKDLIKAEHDAHGSNLRDGESRKRILDHAADEMRNPRASQMSAQTYLTYRNQRLKVVKPATTNRELSYLKAVFNFCRKNRIWRHPNPLENVQPIKIQELELSFLTLEQVKVLLSHLASGRNLDALLITKICLATGCRWSEAEELRLRQLQPGQIQFAKTKGGKARAVPIPSDLHSELSKREPAERGGQIFQSSMGAFKHAIGVRALTSPKAK